MKLKLPRRPKEKEPEKPKFNFKTTVKATSTPKRYISELDDKTKEQLVQAWKILHSRAKKKKLGEHKQLFEDIKMYLKTKYHVEVPRS